MCLNALYWIILQVWQPNNFVLKTVKHLPDSIKVRTFALSKGKKTTTLFNNIKRNTIMEKLDFTFEELVNRLTFTEDDYNKEAELKGGLNPCCNGCCSLTSRNVKSMPRVGKVLILVLMDAVL